MQAYRLKVGYAATDRLSFNLGLSRSDIHNDSDALARDDLQTIFSANQPDDRVLDTYNLIGEYRWSGVSLLSSTAYVDYDINNTDNFMLSVTLPSTVRTVNPLESFSQEVRLASTSQGPWQWTTGAIYKDTEEYFQQDARPDLPQVYRLTEASESYAVFGEAMRRFADGRYELTGGLRYFQRSPGDDASC